MPWGCHVWVVIGSAVGGWLAKFRMRKVTHSPCTSRTWWAGQWQHVWWCWCRQQPGYQFLPFVDITSTVFTTTWAWWGHCVWWHHWQLLVGLYIQAVMNVCLRCGTRIVWHLPCLNPPHTMLCPSVGNCWWPTLISCKATLQFSCWQTDAFYIMHFFHLYTVLFIHMSM